MMQTTWLGRLGYAEALSCQEALVADKIADPLTPDAVFLLEHEPIYTMGRTPDETSLRDPAALPYPLVRSSRGGQATYHGPGQLIGYPVLDLRRRGPDLHRYLRELEGALLALLAEFGLAASRRSAPTHSGDKSPHSIASFAVPVRGAWKLSPQWSD